MTLYAIGVDIGGTNTDVVLVDHNKKIVDKEKVLTTKSIEYAAVKAISILLSRQTILPSQIEAVYFGTTHATNAVLEAKNLLEVGLIRIAGHRPDSSPGYFWPKELRKAALKAEVTIDGGYECDGSITMPLNKGEVKEAIEKLLIKGVSAISVVGVFSPLNSSQEEEVKALVLEHAGKEMPVTLSHEIGGLGFLERENGALLNSALKKVISDGFKALSSSMQKLGISAPLYMVQNDGSIMDIETARNMPILTISAGQTNSFVGGASLAELDRALVVDIGGTSTDIGCVLNGTVRRSCHAANIGGVELHFAMPDVLSLSLGGGSIIQKGEIGPQSVARNIREEAQCFGGNTLTLTDVGIVTLALDIPGANRERIKIGKQEALKLLADVQKRLTYALQIAMGKEKDIPIVLVGGASPILEQALVGTPFARLIAPVASASVANAFGSSLAAISATATYVGPLAFSRDAKIAELKRKASDLAIKKGATKSSCRIANIEIIPYGYSKDGLAKVSVTACGNR